MKSENLNKESTVNLGDIENHIPAGWKEHEKGTAWTAMVGEVGILLYESKVNKVLVLQAWDWNDPHNTVVSGFPEDLMGVGSKIAFLISDSFPHLVNSTCPEWIHPALIRSLKSRIWSWRIDQSSYFSHAKVSEISRKMLNASQALESLGEKV